MDQAVFVFGQDLFRPFVTVLESLANLLVDPKTGILGTGYDVAPVQVPVLGIFQAHNHCCQLKGKNMKNLPPLNGQSLDLSEIFLIKKYAKTA
jgi:hypothetical protein